MTFLWKNGILFFKEIGVGFGIYIFIFTVRRGRRAAAGEEDNEIANRAEAEPRDKHTEKPPKRDAEDEMQNKCDQSGSREQVTFDAEKEGKKEPEEKRADFIFHFITSLSDLYLYFTIYF